MTSAPKAARNGGRLVAAGTPEEIARVRKSHTGQALRPLLNGHLANGNGHLKTDGEKASKAGKTNDKKPVRRGRKSAA